MLYDDASAAHMRGLNRLSDRCPPYLVDMQVDGLDKEYESSYLKDVLGLEEDAKEEDIDGRLIAEAKQLGIDVQMEQQTEDTTNMRPASTPIRSTDALPRRSSVDSRASVAMSTVSTASSLPPSSNGKAPSRASLSFRDYDSFLARGRPEGRASMSFSPPKTPSASTSVFSLPMSSPESSPKKHYRLMRGLSMLKLSRTDSTTSMRGCPHCPRDALSQRRAVHKLPCGHRLCTKALRETIKAATTDAAGAIPSCCGTPIPGCLVEHVMTQQEQSAVLDKLDQWSQANSAAASVKSEARGSTTIPRPGALLTASRTVSDESKVDSVVPETTQQANIEGERPELKQLRTEQADRRDRFTAWIVARRAEMSEKHEGWRRDLRASHEAAVESLEEAHAQSMSEAEDKQVKAEAEMRALHAQEERDSTTALRHMEAYCAGRYLSTGKPHGRTVTGQNLAELENARRAKEGMRARHESAINVLRAEQTRRLRLRGQRQAKEVVELRMGQRGNELDMERSWTDEGRVFEGFVARRWEALGKRWEREERVLGRRLEMGIERGCERDGGGSVDGGDGLVGGGGRTEGDGAGCKAASGAPVD